MTLKLINWVKDGKYRIEVLKILNKNTLLSSELASKLHINRASMSRVLRGLKLRNLVKDISSKSRTVSYVITEQGKNLLGKL